VIQVGDTVIVKDEDEAPELWEECPPDGILPGDEGTVLSNIDGDLNCAFPGSPYQYYMLHENEVKVK